MEKYYRLLLLRPSRINILCNDRDNLYLALHKYTQIVEPIWFNDFYGYQDVYSGNYTCTKYSVPIKCDSCIDDRIYCKDLKYPFEVLYKAKVVLGVEIYYSKPSFPSRTYKGALIF